jgi:hypothetical protein
VAITKKALLAKDAAPAGNVKRHQHVVAHFQLGHLRADFLYYAGEFVPEGHAHAGVGHVAVVQVQVGAANARTGHPHNGIFGMLDLGHGLLTGPDPFRTPEIHG